MKNFILTALMAVALMPNVQSQSSPQKRPRPRFAKEFNYKFSPYSFTILRIKSK